MKLRQEAIDIARTYIGTPYVLAGRVKGAGVDCATLLLLYLIEIGAVDPRDLALMGPYRHDWFHNTTNERYLNSLMRFGRLVAETVCIGAARPQAGNVVLFKVARSKIFNHGAIVTEWPKGIHAEQKGVREVDLASHWLTGQRAMDIFDPWGKK